jgi:hypothetical protein
MSHVWLEIESEGKVQGFRLDHIDYKSKMRILLHEPGADAQRVSLLCDTSGAFEWLRRARDQESVRAFLAALHAQINVFAESMGFQPESQEQTQPPVPGDGEAQWALAE